jgi:hypothetical protein
MTKLMDNGMLKRKKSNKILDLGAGGVAQGVEILSSK